MLKKLRNFGASIRMDKLTGIQARMARGALAWSVRQVAKASGISDSSIRRVESEFGVPESVTLDLLMRLREFYESKGFIFTFGDETPGVAWRRKERRSGRDRRGPGGGPVEASTIMQDVVSVVPMVFVGRDIGTI
jgi:transcriptional regulator with XRE-family HTH domain